MNVLSSKSEVFLQERSLDCVVFRIFDCLGFPLFEWAINGIKLFDLFRIGLLFKLEPLGFAGGMDCIFGGVVGTLNVSVCLVVTPK